MVAGALVAFHPGLVLYGALLMTEPLSALLVLAGFYVAIRVARTGGSRRVMVGIAAGAFVLGVGALVRPQGLLCVPFLVLVIRAGAGVYAGASARTLWRARAMGLVVACVVALLPVLPWTARNCRVMDGCALVSTNAGLEPRHRILSAGDGSLRDAALRGRMPRGHRTGAARSMLVRLRRRADQSGAAPLARARSREARADVRSRVLRGRIPARGTASGVARGATRVGARDAHERASPLRGRGAARVLVAGAGARIAARAWSQTALLAALALASYAAFAADTPTFWPIVIIACVLPWLPLPGRPSVHPALAMSVSLIATTALTHAVFFGEDRYHVVATPVLCLLAAAALRDPARSALAGSDRIARASSGSSPS